jgi:ATP-binding cassette subfamily B protein/subfamily B ATP-binding cassette protein MsbA
MAGAVFLGVIILTAGVGVLKDYRQRLLNVRVMLSLRRSLFERLLHLPLPKLWDMKPAAFSRASRRRGYDHRAPADGDRVAVDLGHSPGDRGQYSDDVELATGTDSAGDHPGAMLMSFTFSRRIRPIYRSLRKDAERIDGRVGETFSGIRVVRAFRRE